MSSAALIAALVAAGLCATTVEGGLVFTAPQQLVGRDVPTVAPIYKHLGRQSLSAEAELKAFSAVEAAEFCGPLETFHERRGRLHELYGGRVLVMHGVSMSLCFDPDGSVALRDAAWAYRHWCQLGAVAVLTVHDNVPGLFFNDHDGDEFKALLQSYPFMANCTLLEVEKGIEGVEAMLSFLLNYSSVGQGPVAAAVLTVDPSACADLFGRTGVQVLFRLGLGGAFTCVALKSLWFLRRWAGNPSPHKLPATLALAIQGVSCAILGVALILGAGRLSDKVGHDLNQFIMQAFFGS